MKRSDRAVLLWGAVTAITACLAVAAAGLAAQARATDDAPSPELDALSQYIGTWRAEDRSTADGRTAHFQYELSWFDDANTIVEMRILERFSDGEDRVLWKGFKGWDPRSESTYYHGFSPGGRAAHGHVEIRGPNLVTEYDGWSPSSGVVRVLDVFTPVVDAVFSGLTLVKTSPDTEWNQVSADRWTRVSADGETQAPGTRGTD